MRKLPRKVKIIGHEEPTYGPDPGADDLSAVATVIGRFDSRENIDIASALYPYGRYGYGHLSGLPARLVIVDVRDIAQFRRQNQRAK